MITVVIIMGIALIVVAWMMSKAASRTVQAHGIVDGDVMYSDLNPEKVEKPLFSSRYRLVGKPDYIVRQNGDVIPVEIKNTLADTPFENHVLQLAAYCLLVEEKYSTRVPYGYLVYGDRKQFRIEFDERLRERLMETMQEMRDMDIQAEGPVERNHESRAKCEACSFKDNCPARIG